MSMTEIQSEAEQFLERLARKPSSYGEARANSIPYHELLGIAERLAKYVVPLYSPTKDHDGAPFSH